MMKLISDHKKCSGCGVCKLSCSIQHFDQVTPARALLRIDAKFPSPGYYEITFCDQCGECAQACPVEAIEWNEEQKIYQINQEDCTACHACVDTCPKSIMIINPEDGIPAKCILCGECAAVCPRQAIILIDQEAEKERI